MFQLTCSFLLLHRYELLLVFGKKKLDEKQRNDISDIFISEDIKNMSLVSQMVFHMKSMSGIFYSKTLISM